MVVDWKDMLNKSIFDHHHSGCDDHGDHHQYTGHEHVDHHIYMTCICPVFTPEWLITYENFARSSRCFISLWLQEIIWESSVINSLWFLSIGERILSSTVGDQLTSIIYLKREYCHQLTVGDLWVQLSHCHSPHCLCCWQFKWDLFSLLVLLKFKMRFFLIASDDAI